MSPTRPANDSGTAEDSPLTERLLAVGLVSQSQLASAQREARETSRRVLDILIDRGLVDDEEVAALLSFELGVPWVRPSLIRYDIRFAELLPRWVAEALCVLPVFFKDRADGSLVLFLAMDDPTDKDTILACSIWAGMPVRPLVACTVEVRETIEEWYSAPRVAVVA